MSSSYTTSNGDTAWVIVCACLVFLMSPALGFFYAGLARAKNALSLMYLTILSVAIVSLQWYLVGYSLIFSKTGNSFMGDSGIDYYMLQVIGILPWRSLLTEKFSTIAHFLLRGVGSKPAFDGQTIPASAFMIFQAMFACITPALAFGSAAERMSSSNGWLYKMGIMDYAGGIPVHISSGLAAVAYAMVLGKRRDYHENSNIPHNVSFVFLGLALLWFGWFAFNAGSALAANARSVNSLVCTHFSSCTAALLWVLLEYSHTRKWSIIGLCTGAVAGLATITPGSGFVSPSSSLAFGVVGSIVCYVAIHYKHKMRIDDCLDVFGVFAQRDIIALGYPENTPLSEIPLGGWLDGNWIQMPIQLAGIAVVSSWSFVVTYLILLIINKIPHLYLRLADEDEIVGTDWAEMGERAYGYIAWDGRSIHNSSSDNSYGINNSNSQMSNHNSDTGLEKGQSNTLNGMLGLNNPTAEEGVPGLQKEHISELKVNSEGFGTSSVYKLAKGCTGVDIFKKETNCRSFSESKDSVKVYSISLLADNNTSTFRYKIISSLTEAELRMVKLDATYTTETVYPTLTTTSIDLVYATVTSESESPIPTSNVTPYPNSDFDDSWEERITKNYPLLLGFGIAGALVILIFLSCFLYRLYKYGRRVYKQNVQTSDLSFSTVERNQVPVPTFGQCLSESYDRTFRDQLMVEPYRINGNVAITGSYDNSNHIKNTDTNRVSHARSASLASLQRWLATLFDNKTLPSSFCETDNDEKAFDSVKLQLTREQQSRIKLYHQKGKKNSLPTIDSGNNYGDKRMRSQQGSFTNRRSNIFPHNNVSMKKKNVTINEEAVIINEQLTSKQDKLLYGGNNTFEIDTGRKKKSLTDDEEEMAEQNKEIGEKSVVFTCAGGTIEDPMNLQSPLSPTFKLAPRSPMKLVKRDEILRNPNRQRGIDEIEFAHEEKMKGIMRNAYNDQLISNRQLTERAREKQPLNKDQMNQDKRSKVKDEQYPLYYQTITRQQHQQKYFEDSRSINGKSTFPEQKRPHPSVSTDQSSNHLRPFVRAADEWRINRTEKYCPE
ncbi:ammonium transporter AmtB-like domain-containing protein [Mycotypha africana]|uniref:ammonium transporter AmtB-like domain-containing protein n=1 Tax=Mycotypha africana TaxID=64632 RepID=UPI002300ACEB|nr:ammonium transporter AmtB-like domain-containing protein [Mycotypha africana]KAI8975768.1 ammonium transporter AmtB-like domain-containing protein [Mycotypha africana]